MKIFSTFDRSILEPSFGLNPQFCRTLDTGQCSGARSRPAAPFVCSEQSSLLAFWRGVILPKRGEILLFEGHHQNLHAKPPLFRTFSQTLWASQRHRLEALCNLRRSDSSSSVLGTAILDRGAIFGATRVHAHSPRKLQSCRTVLLVFLTYIHRPNLTAFRTSSCSSSGSTASPSSSSSGAPSEAPASRMRGASEGACRRPEEL